MVHHFCYWEAGIGYFWLCSKPDHKVCINPYCAPFSIFTISTLVYFSFISLRRNISLTAKAFSGAGKILRASASASGWTFATCILFAKGRITRLSLRTVTKLVCVQNFSNFLLLSPNYCFLANARDALVKYIKMHKQCLIFSFLCSYLAVSRGFRSHKSVGD